MTKQTTIQGDVHKKTIDFLESQRGKHFEPRLVDLIIEIMPKILDIKATFKDED